MEHFAPFRTALIQAGWTDSQVKKQEREFVDNVMTDTLDDSKDKDDDDYSMTQSPNAKK